jgi:hypothetical protein
MNGTLGVAVATTGLLITVVGVVGANVVFVRFVPMALRRPITTETRIAILESVLRVLLFAAIAMIGLTALLFGLAVTGSLVAWAPLAPLAVAALMIPTGWYARSLLRRLRP